MGPVGDALERNYRELIRERLDLVSELVVQDTRDHCSRRSGATADSVQCDPWVDQGSRFTSVVSAGRGLENPNVARYLDEGTGIDGPEGTRIVPDSAQVLAFDWPAAGGTVFARSVAGMRGTHFFMEPMPDRYAAACRAAFL